jgi:LuxR family transcriptional regulator, maltose regulon positive regulatory protein
MPRSRIAAMLDEGFTRGLTLVSASAGFGKTTAISDWISKRAHKAAWLSLDAADSDPVTLLAYLSAALRPIGAAGLPDPAALLGSPAGISAESALTGILDACEAVAEPFLLVLDDWHAADSPEADRILSELVARLPEPMRLVLSTREDPSLPLARLRAQGILAEIRTSDLRFTADESAEFLRGAIDDRFGRDEAAAVDGRVEGWAAGLQLTAVALRGKSGIGRSGGREELIASLAGSGRFVLDYLFEEVFAQQEPRTRDFLLRTSILERFSGPLCEALFGSDGAEAGRGRGQDAIEALERANLFIIPLDDERRWYRYHHLFSELLRHRLERDAPEAAGGTTIAELHRRAAAWLEAAALGVEAFRHATAAGDIDAALRLLDGPLMPQHSREAANAAVDWLASLPDEEKRRRPELWVRYATSSLAAGRIKGVEECLRSAEAVLAGAEGDAAARDLEGRISTARATLAMTRYDAKGMIAYSIAALDSLASEDHAFRASAGWILGTAYQSLGRREEAGRVFEEALAASRAARSVFSEILAVTSIGELRETGDDLHGALAAYEEGIALGGEHPLPSACEAHLGKARVLYERNDLDAAEASARRALSLARTYEAGIDRFVPCEVFLARIELARGRAAAAAAALETIEGVARGRGFALRLPEIAAAKAQAAIARDNPEAALRYAKESGLARLEARSLLACGRAGESLAVVERWLAAAKERGLSDEILKSGIVRALALGDAGKDEEALSALREALAMAESGGIVRSFADEGPSVARLLEAMAAESPLSDHASRVLAACRPGAAAPAESLSAREREVLALVALGLSNQEIGERLFLALDSVKGHNRRIFEKLGVQRRTEAVARARELGLL